MQTSDFRYNYTHPHKTQGDAAHQRPLRPPPPAYPVKGGMEIGGLLNARNAAVADAQLRRQLQQSMQVEGGVAYAMNHNQGPTMLHHAQHHMQHPGAMGYPSLGQPQHPAHMYGNNFIPRHDTHAALADDNFGAMKPRNEGAPKAFACSTCQKGFARRSDLARHGESFFARSLSQEGLTCLERIHSGIRPHACDYPGCGKQFIQRSALTVHARVHTGEKPHMCERCGKVSDSGLAMQAVQNGLTRLAAIFRLEFTCQTSQNSLWQAAVQMSVCQLPEDVHSANDTHSAPKSPHWDD